MVSMEISPDGGDGIHEKALGKLENQESPPSNSSEETLLETDTGVHISQLDKDGSISSIKPRALQTPHTDPPAVRNGQEGKNPVVREKGFEDGYHWRKYGQKLVKGNEFVRSYYRCTHPSCLVKKQLERSHSGNITDIVYFGEHVHPKPVNNVPMAVGFVLSVEERPYEHSPIATKDKTDKAAKQGKATSQVDSTSNSQVSTVALNDNTECVLPESNKLRDHKDKDEDQRSKRQKKSIPNPDPASADKPTGDPHFVVQTMSEVNIVNDGYRWRKYGQKMVKGNPHPRSYYRCSTVGCPAKKHVEKASHDEKLIITSYAGRHDHDLPPSRTLAHNASGKSLHTESRSKSGSIGVHDDSPTMEPLSVNTDLKTGGGKKMLKLEPRQMNSELQSEGNEKAAHSSWHIENKSEQQNDKSNDAAKDVNSDIATATISGSVHNGRPSEKNNSEPKAKPQGEGDGRCVKKITDNHHIAKARACK